MIDYNKITYRRAFKKTQTREIVVHLYENNHGVICNDPITLADCYM